MELLPQLRPRTFHGVRVVTPVAPARGTWLDGVHEGDLPGAAPQVGYMQAGVGRALVKTNGSDGAAGVRLKRNSQLDRPDGPIINRCRHNRARPDGLLRQSVSGAGQGKGEAQ